MNIELLLVFYKFFICTASLFFLLYLAFNLFLCFSCHQRLFDSARFLASVIHEELLDSCTDSDVSPNGVPLKQFIEAVFPCTAAAKISLARFASASVFLLGIVLMCLGQSFGLSNHSGPDGHTLLNWSTLQTLLPISAGLWLLSTCLH